MNYRHERCKIPAKQSFFFFFFTNKYNREKDEQKDACLTQMGYLKLLSSQM